MGFGLEEEISGGYRFRLTSDQSVHTEVNRAKYGTDGSLQGFKKLILTLLMWLNV
jgi:hypothetical protein